jgi:formate dehydrogenase accessory protein FdhE
MINPKWDARGARARTLQALYPFADEGLAFYANVAASLQSLYADYERRLGSHIVRRLPGMLRGELDLPLLIPRFPELLSVVAQKAPQPLRACADQLRNAGEARWKDSLPKLWEAAAPGECTLEPAEALLCWIFLQPYAEYLADHTQPFAINSTPSRCPLCNSLPIAGVLRPEGDGAKRSLICSLCAHEWAYRRLVCAACGEEDVTKLVVYTAPNFPHVRVEACDSCRHYIKTIDLTKDGHAIPVVDELATIPLNLWAAEQGYSKLQLNLLGL